MKTAERMTNSELVASETAFRGWSEMRQRLATGYAPTLRRGNKRQVELGTRIQSYGFRVFWRD